MWDNNKTHKLPLPVSVLQASNASFVWKSVLQSQSVIKQDEHAPL
jgi:hypothetical protein